MTRLYTAWKTSNIIFGLLHEISKGVLFFGANALGDLQPLEENACALSTERSVLGSQRALEMSSESQMVIHDRFYLFEAGYSVLVQKK